MANYQSASVSVLLDKRTARKNGTFPLKLYIYYESTNKKYGIKISLTEDEWDKLNGKKLKQESLQNIKKIIDAEIGKATDIINKLGNEFSIELFDSLYLDKPIDKKNLSDKNILYNLYIEFIKDLRDEDRIGNAEAYETAMKSIKKFSPNLPLNKLTPKFLREYEKWMLENGKSITTVGIYLRTLRTIANIAKTKKYLNDETYPFGLKSKKKYEIPIGENIKKALPTEDLRKIINAKFKTKEGEFARDLWLFSLYCNGMNMVDIYSLKYSNIQDEFIYFNRIKTARTKKRKSSISVFISEPVAKIIKVWGNKDKNPDNYIFNVFNNSMTPEDKFKERHNKTRCINGYMKRLSKKLKLNSKLTTYVARHSWATISKNDGVSVAEISEGLGHSSLETTKHYLDSFPQEHKKNTAQNFQNKLLLEPE